MANLRRHFNFSQKSSGNQDREMPYYVSNKPYRHFDKDNFMNDICHCLDLCCAYIQALNSLCDAGSSLARNLFQAVREVPVFHNVSLQFLSVWEEVSKATAGASAAVKTETLMMLQEILNSLEMSKNGGDSQKAFAESFQVIGNCLCSFIDLQAQFSLNTWKSFSKLAKHFTSDSVKHSLQWKPHDKAQSKITVNVDLHVTIKKHFSQFSKMKSENTETTQVPYFSPYHQRATEIPVLAAFGNQNISDNVEDPAECATPTWNSSDSSFFPKEISNKEFPVSSNYQSELDEVINLLSCVPVQQTSPNQNYFNQYQMGNDQMYPVLPKMSGPPMVRRLGSQPWSKEMRHPSVGCEPWLWTADNMNCSGLPANLDSLQRTTEGTEQKDFEKLNTYDIGSSSNDGSSTDCSETQYYVNGIREFYERQSSSSSTRKHIGGESMPGGLENISESKEEGIWDIHSKTSTWPLQQSSHRNTELEYSTEKSDYPS